MDTPNILTSGEVAALLKIHLKTVYKLAEAGNIPGSRIGRSWRFNRNEVLHLVSSNPDNGGAKLIELSKTNRIEE
jgi:excisionase family DNA binding protein